MNIDKMKELFNSGDWICIWDGSGSWEIITPDWTDFNYKLIHKKHKAILDAVLADSSVEVEKLDMYGKWMLIPTADFIDYYDEGWSYQLATRQGEKETLTIKDGEKVYEFEKPDFECELLKVYGNKIVGATQCETNNEWMEEKWSIGGKSKHHKKWDLTPIKPKWYEDESNFPCVVTDGKKMLMVDSYEYTKENNTHWVSFSAINVGELYNLNLEHYRLATNKEIDKLKVKDS